MTAIDRITDLAKMTREKRPLRQPGPPDSMSQCRLSGPSRRRRRMKLAPDAEN
jgi:hypothetical protein